MTRAPPQSNPWGIALFIGLIGTLFVGTFWGAREFTQQYLDQDTARLAVRERALQYGELSAQLTALTLDTEYGTANDVTSTRAAIDVIRFRSPSAPIQLAVYDHELWTFAVPHNRFQAMHMIGSAREILASDAQADILSRCDNAIEHDTSEAAEAYRVFRNSSQGLNDAIMMYQFAASNAYRERAAQRIAQLDSDIQAAYPDLYIPSTHLGYSAFDSAIALSEPGPEQNMTLAYDEFTKATQALDGYAYDLCLRYVEVPPAFEEQLQRTIVEPKQLKYRDSPYLLPWPSQDTTVIE